ncbi:MAG: SURF1 family cytochrome oxidase biogenesis protein [Mycobacteriaceae bacterium]|uniref:SURF1 family cytochrome oxidase biogenesis protein n=1 Tax=Corynebacterium sp. TaxID=1720 RepID=UPI003F97ED72
MTEPASPPRSARRRRGWRSFLTPGWVLTTIVAVVFAYFAFTVLAPWQLGKNRDTQEFQDRLNTALETDPVPASEVLPADGSSAGEQEEWTRVELQGRFVPGDEALLRNRPVGGTQAYQALTPFQLNGGQTVMVNRGWMDASDGQGVQDVPAVDGSPTTVTGYVRMSEAAPDNDPMSEGGRLQVYGMSTAAVGEAVGVDYASDYVQLDGPSVEATDGDGSMSALPLPDLDSGPYLSYGLQWIAFGVMVPLGLAYFIWAEIRERRRRRDEVAAAEPARQVDTEGQDAAASSAGADPQQPAGATTAAPSRERKLEDRYGGSRSRFFEKRNARDEERF